MDPHQTRKKHTWGLVNFDHERWRKKFAKVKKESFISKIFGPAKKMALLMLTSISIVVSMSLVSLQVSFFSISKNFIKINFFPFFSLVCKFFFEALAIISRLSTCTFGVKIENITALTFLLFYFQSITIYTKD